MGNSRIPVETNLSAIWGFLIAFLLGMGFAHAQSSENLAIAEPLTENIPLSEPEKERLNGLFEKLHSSKFQEREDATTELAQLDERYLSELKEKYGQERAPDAKARLYGIVLKLEAERGQRITREFMRLPNAEESHPFRGWRSFIKASGFKDRKTKALFLQLLEAYPWLVHEEITSSQDAYEKGVRVASEISPRLDVAGEVTEEDGIALAYTIALCEEKLDVGLEMTGHRVFSRHPFSTRLVSVNRSAISSSSNAILTFYDKFATHAKNRRLILFSCLNGGIPAAKKIAVEILSKQDATKDLELFELSMHSLARFGTEEEIPIVDKWLEDETVVREQEQVLLLSPEGGRPVQIEVQARDLALATTMLLHKENPYVLLPHFRPHPLRGFATESVGHPSKTTKADRDALLKRWRERLENMPKTLEP